MQYDLELMIHSNRMEWEPWIETCDSYANFQKILRDRGYQNLPSSPTPLIKYQDMSREYPTDTSKLPHQKTMLRKAN